MEERLDLVRRLLLTLPNRSPLMLMPWPKRFRPMTSKPKIAARDRTLAVGVEGRELFPVENLNSPYCWTVNELR